MQGRTCDLPSNEKLTVVDIEGEDGDSESIFAVRSDSSVVWFGESFPPTAYGPTAEANDQPCITQILTNGWTIGRSYEHSITMLDVIPEQYGLSSTPATLDIPDGSVSRVAFGLDVLALDSRGEAWVLWKRLPEAGIVASGTFERLNLPEKAVFADGASGWCVTLESGRVWCLNRSNNWPRFGQDIGLGKLRELSVKGARTMVLSIGNSCWLDLGGVTRCAGYSGGGILGYDENLFPNFVRDQYDVVPGLPPLDRLWIRLGGACGTTSSDELWCWGSNFWGQLDSEDERIAISPVHVGTFPGLKDVAMTRKSTCLLLADATVVCRGLAVLFDHVPGTCLRDDGWYEVPLAGPANCEEGL